MRARLKTFAYTNAVASASKTAFISLMLLGLGACGQKGALILPDSKTPTIVTSRGPTQQAPADTRKPKTEKPPQQ
jgi:predicted small lipoprotein YifL